MKPSEIKASLQLLVKAQQPTFVWGAPGVGKSQVIAQVAADMGLELKDVRAVLLDPVDLRGLPHVNGDNRAHWAIPDFLPRDGSGILFLDELNAAPPLVQAACYQLVLDRKLGEYELPDGWTVIAAGNRESDKAVTSRMPTPLANRFVHLEFDIDLNDWRSWALDAGIKTELIGFLNYRPALLHQFNPKANFDGAKKAFPSPRSWEFVSRILEEDPGPEIEFPLIAGTVGEPAAAEICGFLKIFRKLPNPDTVLMQPDSFEAPNDPATLYALCGALARKASDTNMDRMVKVAGKMPSEFSVLLINDCYRINPDVANTRAFQQWASDNQDILF